MWMTGFDVPSLGTLYLDKPLKAHTLMQAIARANRVAEGKTNGLIVDYCGILKNLRRALATFAGATGEGEPGSEGVDPAQPEERLLDLLDGALAEVTVWLSQRQVPLSAIVDSTGFQRNKAILDAKESINENDETRKRFELMARAVLARFKSCVHVAGDNERRARVDAVVILYKSLRADVEQADISHILLALREEVNQAIVAADAKATPGGMPAVAEDRLFDISKIDFAKLLTEFQRSRRKQTTVQSLKAAIESRLAKLLAMNPARKNYQEQYEQIVADYNREVDRATIEATFQRLLLLSQGLSDEEQRAVELGLDEETLALFDLLRKPDLDKRGIERLKAVSRSLLATLKARLSEIADWQATESNRAAVRVAIQDFLYDDTTGLPLGLYDERDVELTTEAVYEHVWRVYPTLPSPIYA
jgi:type I restriction enzyme R subunit